MGIFGWSPAVDMIRYLNTFDEAVDYTEREMKTSGLSLLLVVPPVLK